MRIWDIEPKYLCRNHLLGEHVELHALWSIITNNKKGFSRHPETERWRGKLKALYARHGFLVEEMKKRKYIHKTPLNEKLAIGKPEQDKLLQSVDQQKKLLRGRCSRCLF